jgi:ATP-dependent RNA helicase DeaD
VRDRGERHANGRNPDAPPSTPRGRRRQESGRQDSGEIPFETFRIEVGHVHGVKPGNIVGAIANEAGLEGRYIGQVDIRGDHSFVDLPEGMPKDIFRSLKKTRVAGQELRIKRAEQPPR